MKIGVSTYSYITLTNSGSMTLTDVLSHAAETGYEQIDFVELPQQAGMGLTAYADTLRLQAKEKGLEIAAYTVGAELLNPENGSVKDEVKRVQGCLDVAAALGAKMLRHDVTRGPVGKQMCYKEVVKAIAPYIREIADYGQSLGIKTMTENHGYYIQDSYRMEHLVEEVNHANYGLLIDIGNFLCVDETPISAVGRLAAYAIHVHAKDFLVKSGAQRSPGDGWFQSRGGEHLRGTIVGHGVVPVGQCLKILRDSGYKGGISMEFEGLENTLYAAQAAYNYLKSVV